MKKSTEKQNKGINTYLPNFRGFYGSIYEDVDFWGEAEHYGLSDKFPFYDFVNWSDYYNAVAKEIKNFVEQALIEHGFVKEITFQQMVSPREYNFTNDSVNCEIVPVQPAIKAFIYENLDAFKQYLIDHLKSRSGFISFHSHYFEDWKEMTEDFTNFEPETNVGVGFHLGFLLQFICSTHEGLIEDLSIENEYYHVNERVFISEYYNEDFDKIIELKENTAFYDFENGDIGHDTLVAANEIYGKIREFVQRYYSLLPNIFDAAKIQFCEEETYYEGTSEQYSAYLYGNFEAYIQHCISEIDNQPAQLKLKLAA